MIWFTSDTHFNHDNIIKYCNRPFSSITEMNEALIKNWNELVKPDDTIYHLGDFGFGKIENIVRRLNGRKYLIIGSHDKNIKRNLFEKVDHIMIVENIVLCHYSMRTWPKSHRNSYHLYGHSHGKLDGLGKSFDAGVDCWDFKPISIEKVKEEMNKRVNNFNFEKYK